MAKLAAQPVLKLQTTTTNGDLEFNRNTAYFGGVIYAEEDTPTSAIKLLVASTSARPIKFVSNEAKSAGGVALLPQELLPSLVPSGKSIFSENSAFDFGCLFAYAETFSDSNTAGECSFSLDAQYSGNFNKSSGYQWATHCLQLDEVCKSSPPSSPASPVSPPAVSSCSRSDLAPPGAFCAYGKWYISASSLPPDLKLETPIIIFGGGTISSVTVTNVFQSADSMITSLDCTTVNHITVDLSNEDTEKLQGDAKAVATLLRSSCSTSSTRLTIIKVKTDRACQKVKNVRDDSKNYLTVTFTVQSSNCDRWWIILVSVLCGVILLVLIALIIILLLPSRYRAKLQPFHKSQDAPTTRTATYTTTN